MKILLQRRFDSVYWAQTFDSRQLDLTKGWRMVTMKKNWPFLFTKQGVIFSGFEFLH